MENNLYLLNFHCWCTFYVCLMNNDSLLYTFFIVFVRQHHLDVRFYRVPFLLVLQHDSNDRLSESYPREAPPRVPFVAATILRIETKAVYRYRRHSLHILDSLFSWTCGGNGQKIRVRNHLGQMKVRVAMFPWNPSLDVSKQPPRPSNFCRRIPFFLPSS
jgi:hypothetical protein